MAFFAVGPVTSICMCVRWFGRISTSLCGHIMSWFDSECEIKKKLMTFFNLNLLDNLLFNGPIVNSFQHFAIWYMKRWLLLLHTCRRRRDKQPGRDYSQIVDRIIKYRYIFIFCVFRWFIWFGACGLKWYRKLNQTFSSIWLALHNRTQFILKKKKHKLN